MPIRRRALLAAPLAAPLISPARAAEGTVTLTAADGVAIAATATPAPRGPARGTVLLFHMAGSNRAEYAPVAPELARRGFACLAIDQRSGGAGFGARNETVARLGGRDPGYLAALPDLEAALAWAGGQPAHGPILVCGSSYSAALVFLLAARHPGGIAAILAFSPGEYLRGASVGQAAARIDCPAFVTGAADPEETAAARAILGVVRNPLRVQHVPEVGPHGASALRMDRNPRGAAACWRALDGFLDRAVPPA